MEHFTSVVNAARLYKPARLTVIKIRAAKDMFNRGMMKSVITLQLLIASNLVNGLMPWTK